MNMHGKYRYKKSLNKTSAGRVNTFLERQPYVKFFWRPSTAARTRHQTAGSRQQASDSRQ